MYGMSTGVERIAAERQRQITDEGYTPQHDAEHDGGDLALAAAVYAAHATPEFDASTQFPRLSLWPWRDEDFKPVDRLTCLVKAGALIAAEIDRIAPPEAAPASRKSCTACDYGYPASACSSSCDCGAC